MPGCHLPAKMFPVELFWGQALRWHHRLAPSGQVQVPLLRRRCDGSLLWPASLAPKQPQLGPRAAFHLLPPQLLNCHLRYPSCHRRLRFARQGCRMSTHVLGRALQFPLAHQ